MENVFFALGGEAVMLMPMPSPGPVPDDPAAVNAALAVTEGFDGLTSDSITYKGAGWRPAQGDGDRDHPGWQVRFGRNDHAQLHSGTLMLEVDNLSVRYGAISAVRGASLKVDPGEIVSLLGSNGAGKSSLVSAVVGIIPTAGGTVRFEGEDITRANAEAVVARGMTLTPEGRRVFGDLSVHENLILGAATNRNRAQVRQDIEKYFDMFPILRERSQQLAKTLSGGEQQMLAIARSLMSRPRLLMLDEPSLGLAPRIVDGIFDLMVKLRDEGLTILVVEQNASEALSIADRAYIMTTGAVVYEGKAAELVGSDNLMDAYLGASVG